MKLGERLVDLRKRNGYSQEELSEKIGVSRQSVGKWETDQAVPELSALIKLSELYNTTIDRIVKSGCCESRNTAELADTDAMVDFLIRAKRNTYAAHGAEIRPSRPMSHDLAYSEGDYSYIDSYLGGDSFCGEEAVWIKGSPVWSMNYCGRVTDQAFSGDFLKEALMNVPKEAPYRGPALYRRGDFTYHCVWQGELEWFHGFEEIFCEGRKIYECHFHGGKIR